VLLVAEIELGVVVFVVDSLQEGEMLEEGVTPDELDDCCGPHCGGEMYN
jgi:hypothetical protein